MRVYTQAEINNLTRILIQRIMPYRRLISYVVGIANGGLYVSKPIATALQIPHTSVRISRYEGSQLREHPIIEGQPPKSGTLVVDDLIDDGVQ
jgi:hypoxanthine phosphoribosyltransferase